MLPTSQAVGVHHLWLGETVVTALSDGWFDGSFDFVTEPDKASLEALQRDAFRTMPPRMQVNTFLIRAPNQKPVLVDAGSGTRWFPTLGRQTAALAAAGVSPGDIGTVLMTHLHLDHVGGLADAQGVATYPHAELVMDAREAGFWLDGRTPPEPMADAFALARANTAPYAGRTRPAEPGEVAPGVTLVPLYGHTPGHCGFRLDGGGMSVLLVGDLVHFPGFQFANPDPALVFDSDPAEATATRKRTLEMAASERLLIGGNHLDFPGFGHVERAGAGYRYVPMQWQYAA